MEYVRRAGLDLAISVLCHINTNHLSYLCKTNLREWRLRLILYLTAFLPW